MERDFARPQRGFVSTLILLGVLAILVFAAGAFYLKKQISRTRLVLSTKKPAEVNNPSRIKQDKKYTNKDLGFEFTYPKIGFSAKEDSEEAFNERALGSANKKVNGDFRKNFADYVQYSPGKVLGAVSLLYQTNSFDNAPFSVWVFENPNKLDPVAWYNKYWYYPFLWGDFSYDTRSKAAPVNDEIISSRTAKYAEIDYQPGKPKFYYLSDDKRMFLLKVINDDQNTGDKIIATFKFL